MSDEVETISKRDELRNMFRFLCMGRPIAAEKLADLLAPLFEQPAPAGAALPVLDMQALTTSELAALSTQAPEPVVDIGLDQHIQHVQEALANETKVGDPEAEAQAEPQLEAGATPAAEPAAPAKTTTKARKAR